MGHFNEILAGRFNRFVQKHFSMKGREGAPTLAADIAMTMNFDSGAENRYLQGWELFAAAAALGSPGVGNFQTVSLRNPPNSGVAAVVTNAIIGETTATTVVSPAILRFFRGATTDQNNAQTTLAMDHRSRPNASLILTNNTAAPAATGGTGQTIAAVSGAANNEQDFLPGNLEIPLMPGDALVMNSGSANDSILFVLWWRERALESSEFT